MASTWYLARRTAFALLALWIVVTATFLVVGATGDPNEAMVRYAAAQEVSGSTMSEAEMRAHIEEAVEEYRDERGRDRPLHEQYADWFSNVATLQWGLSESRHEPVTGLLAERLAVTATYVVPGIAVAMLGGVGLGTYAAFGRRERLSRVATVGTYTIYGIPNFWIAAVALAIVPAQFGVALTGYDLDRSLLSPSNLRLIALPALLLGTGLVAGLAQHVRTELLERESRPYVRTARAGGVAERRVAYRVLRAAALPLLALTFSKLLGVLLVNVFVLEYVFDLPGFGSLTLRAITDRDRPLIMGATLVIGFVGVAGTYARDLAAPRLDPRVERE